LTDEENRYQEGEIFARTLHLSGKEKTGLFDERINYLSASSTSRLGFKKIL
jgi:hypothetical protein